MALTENLLKGLTPRERPYTVSDGRGLYVEVFPTGGVVWRYRYRLDGRPEKLTLGKYPDLKLAAARRQRDEAAVQVADGESPAKAKKLAKAEARNPNTVAEFARYWLTEVAEKVNKDPRNIRRYIEKDIVPALGSRRLGEVTPADILSLTDRIKRRGADQSALQVRNILKRIYGFALARQVASFNPAAAVEARFIATAKSRDRALSADEVGKLLRAVYASSMRRSHKLAVHLLLLTMCRKGELVMARWEHVDLDANQWNVPETKIGKPHVVYLSHQARELFDELKSLACGSPWVLPSRSSLQQPISLSTLNVAVRALGLEVAAFVIHDFRRTASTHLHEAGFPSDVVERALGHVIGGVRGVYNRAGYAEQRRAMLQQWADIVDVWIDGGKVVTGRWVSVGADMTALPRVA